MENVYAALLLHKLGKEVSEENVKSVVSAAGVDVSDDTEAKIKSLVSSLQNVDIDKELENATIAAAPAAGASGGEASGGESEGGESGEEKKEEEQEEKKEAADGLSALFG